MEEQILVQSNNNYEFVKFAASPMGHGHVLNLNKWIYKVDGAWACPEFKQMDIQSRWDCAKQNKLCFRCLGDGHLGQFCNRTRVCGIDGCKEIHH